MAKGNRTIVSTTLAIACVAAAIFGGWMPTVPAQDAPSGSTHAQQLRDRPTPAKTLNQDQQEAADLHAQGLLFPKPSPGSPQRFAATPRIDPDFIVFGYEQMEDPTTNDPYNHIRWNGLTHVGIEFVYFDANGNLTGTSAFTGRDANYKAGGAADAAGVKVILVVAAFDDAPGGIIDQVMTTPAKRTTLVTAIRNLVIADSYCHGVSMDLEFSWGSSVRDGITAFFQELRPALPSPYELSIYTNPIYSSSQWNFNATTGITPNIDYMLYSGYDFASGAQAHAITDFDGHLGSNRIMGYLNAGLPPEKLIITISTYAGRWRGTNVYNGTGTTGKTAISFPDAMYDTTLNPAYGGPYTNNYVTGDEVSWYTYDNGTTLTTVTWDSVEALEYKVGHALSLQDPAGTWAGRRLRGVGFWSLYWLMEITSWDPITNASASKTRMYPQVYELCSEILKAPGTTRFLVECFEGMHFRWRDPDESPDTTTGVASRAIVAKPVGAGAPADSTNAMQVNFSFTGTAAHKAFFRHEVLAHPTAPHVIDTNAVAANFGANNAVIASIYTPASYSGYTIRMVAMDKDRELEMSDTYTLNASGWRELTWDLTDAAQINARTTTEPAFVNGDGALDTAGGGARDIAFIGFLIEGGTAATGSVTIDEISYEHRNPGGRNYTINEFRYSESSPAAAQEFVEIHGPAGAFPAGFQLRLISRADGTATAISLAGQSIPDDGGGFGYFVVGDPGVPNVDFFTGFANATDDIADATPPALQLYGSATGCVYDSVVFEAYAGLGDLIRKQTLGVAGEGFPWIGEVANGSTAAGVQYAMGRYPDGADTQRNNEDFSAMTASPGAANGGGVSLPFSADFTAAPAQAFQTYQPFHLASPAAAGLPASPGSGGNAHRCVDTSGGGAMSFIGNAALGAGGAGYKASGRVYIPSTGEPNQAIGIGLCGRQGSTFFTNSPAGSGYESGYLLIFENNAGVAMNDGRADHPGVFEFVHATNDNMDGERVSLLGSATLATTGATGGAWTTFEFTVDPNAAVGQQLVAKLNGFTVFSGAIPAGGPVSGAFQVGFRENHTGAPVAAEGAWIDDLSFTAIGGPPAQVGDWPLFAR